MQQSIEKYSNSPPPAMVALMRESNSSSPRMASCRWRGVIRFTFRSLEAFPANSSTYIKTHRLLINYFHLVHMEIKTYPISEAMLHTQNQSASLPYDVTKMSTIKAYSRKQSFWKHFQHTSPTSSLITLSLTRPLQYILPYKWSCKSHNVCTIHSNI